MLRNVALLFASLALTLALCEAGLRVVGLYAPLGYPPTPYWGEWFGAHAKYGYALHPNRSGPFEFPPTEPRTTTLTSNSDGFRQARELDEADHRPRILVAGDSFAFGLGVEEDERFSNLVEQIHPGLRVHNIAIPGFGPDLMLLAVEAVVEKARPDFVVMALYFDDFRRVRARYAGLGFATPRHSLVGDTLTVGPYPTPSLIERLHLYEALMRVRYGGHRIRARLSAAEWTLNERILDRLGELGEDRGFVPVITYLAGRRNDAANDRRRDWTLQYARRHGFPAIDLTGAIHDAPVGAFLPDNGHYSVTGHRQVGMALATFLDSLASR
jgi:hypothetical protein